jgi:formate hydrogenlyase subunit 4
MIQKTDRRGTPLVVPVSRIGKRNGEQRRLKGSFVSFLLLAVLFSRVTKKEKNQIEEMWNLSQQKDVNFFPLALVEWM